MNERIWKLAEQADAYAWQQIDEGADYDKQPQYFAEKFAELIVRECADAIELNSMQISKRGIGEIRTIVKKHFGVEE